MSKPTIRELLDANAAGLSLPDGGGGRGRIYEIKPLLIDRIEAVLKLHRPGADHANHEDFCQNCGEDWPCPTVRALNGEKP